ncbi:hypothetical protein [Novosphingobium sp.]|jgi:hypothetical protein|uniref:hypothetical protein n=1 Tax=Novosphingobium sp. TaxID=1874826 RepID=UPI0022CA1A28|nr:hypothetical protein [Novosphingobium sp.]MCZ8019736.1 hypothetical protein [Novosphingobium sp.]MCZ8035551.1 hypothetical protein [Novosphingobium sp.]MCZ8050865.1 hypothetical protein [Novosphingobium sp.]MCZ8059211.1 hypothetical protein [Novosphingobium sp.]MCZ8232657.1 hypothetical protein [Novosphingobium sp.]
MLNKVSSLARAAGIVLAIVAGFVALGTLDTTMVLVVLGLIAGLSLAADRVVLTGVLVLLMPAVGTALATLPGVGAQLAAVAGNLGTLGAASIGTAFALLLYNRVKEDLGSLTAK